MAEIAQFERRVAEHEMWTRAGPVHSHLDEQEVESLEERSVASLADPTAVGLWGFATGTWIAGEVAAGWLPPISLVAVIPVLLVFAGMVQFIAGLYGLRRANILTGTAMSVFGAFNVTLAVSYLLQASGAMPMDGGVVMRVQGDLLASFGLMALILTFAALRTNLVVVATLGLLCVGYFASAAPQLAESMSGGWQYVAWAGGAFLCASAVCAYYYGAALVVNSTWNRVVLPIFGKV